MGLARIGEILRGFIDNSTQVNTVIDYPHHEVHAGSGYILTDVEAVDTATKKYGLSVPDVTKLPHILFGLECNGEVEILITEGADRTLSNEIASVNQNRGSSNTAGVKVYDTVGVDGTTDGATTILKTHAGATNISGKTAFGGGGNHGNEFILKADTNYVIAVTTYASSTVSLNLEWYEHTSKE